MSKRIAVIVAGINETYQSSILGGIKNTAEKYDMDCYVFVSFTGMNDNKNHDAGEMNIFRLPDFSRFDGAILLTNTIDCPPVVNSILARIKAAGIPAVSVDNRVDGLLYIGIDNRSAMKDITEHFIDVHKFTKINYVSGPENNSESADRLEAFLEAMRENNIPVGKEQIYYGDFREASGRNAVDFFLESEYGMPQAIICANDVMAASVVNRLHSVGIRVPEDIAVSGFDDVFDCYDLRAELTSVERPLERSGKLACKMLYNKINNFPQHESMMLNMLTKFSESCGCGKCNNRRAEGYKEANIINFGKIDTINHYLAVFNSLSSELNAADNFEGYIDALKRFVESVKPGEFYFCLNENWNYQSDEISINLKGEEIVSDFYEDNIIVPIAYRGGIFEENVVIRLEDLIPRFASDCSTSRFYYFLPLHFRERCMGYMVINNCPISLHNSLFQSWCITINNSLENIRKLNALDNAVKKLERLYIQDTFSGIYNRNGFVNATNEVFRECAMESRNIMLMFIDLDGLKVINDTYGHAVGDEAIRAIAEILNLSCRSNEIYCRFGGDEFIVFAADYTDEDAMGLTTEIQENIEEYNIKSENKYNLSASTGYVIAVPKMGEDLFRFVTEADKKMYETKREKKSRYLRVECHSDIKS